MNCIRSKWIAVFKNAMQTLMINYKKEKVQETV